MKKETKEQILTLLGQKEISLVKESIDPKRDNYEKFADYMGHYVESFDKYCAKIMNYNRFSQAISYLENIQIYKKIFDAMEDIIHQIKSEQKKPVRPGEWWIDQVSILKREGEKIVNDPKIPSNVVDYSIKGRVAVDHLFREWNK